MGSNSQRKETVNCENWLKQDLWHVALGWHADIRAAAIKVLPDMVEFGSTRAIEELTHRLQEGANPFRGSRVAKVRKHPVRLAAAEGPFGV